MTTPPGDQPPYGYQQPYGYPVQQDHPKAQTAMVLGVVGLVMCQVAAPFAWMIGKRTVNEIDASMGRLGGRSTAQAGYILGIIGTVLLGLAVVFLVFYFVVVVALIGGMAVGT